MATPHHQTGDRSGSSRTRLVLPIMLDVVAPVVLYYVFTALGMHSVLALTIAGLVPAIRIIYTAITERRLDNLAMLVLLMVVAAIALAFVTGDAQWVLAKESFFTAAAGIWCLVTLLGRKPIMYYAARPFATRGRATREALWEPTWERSERFRAIIGRITLAWGAMFLLDAVARLVVINALPVDKAVFQSQLPGIVLLVVTIIFTRMSGGRLRKILDAQAEQSSR